MSGAQAETAPRWINTFDTSARYYGWSNTIGGSGSQVYVPYAAQTTGRPSDDWKVEFLIRSGYIWSRQTSNGTSISASSPTDTTLGTTFTYFGWNGIHPFVSLNVNMPTASKSSGSSPTTKTDSDIVATPIFGQGWNFGPSFGASFAIDPSLIATASFGYTYRGPFNQGPSLSNTTQTQPVGNLKPGDVYTFNGGLGYKGERLVTQLSVSYSLESTTYANGSPLYRAGDRVIVSAKAGYAWNDNWSSRMSGSFSHFAKNWIPASSSASDLIRETMNSNSDVYRTTIDISYARDNYSIGPTAGYLWRNHNGYDPTNLSFIPAKTSWSAGVTGALAVTKGANISATVQHIWVHESASPDKIDVNNLLIANSGFPESSTNAWVATIGGNVRF